MFEQESHNDGGYKMNNRMDLNLINSYKLKNTL